MIDAQMPALDRLTALEVFAGVPPWLETRMAEIEREGGCLSLAVFDLDCLGKVNEEHGRDVGDAVLRHLAEHLRATSGPEAILARCGGDAMMLVFDGMEKEQAFLRVEEARLSFGADPIVAAAGDGVSLSVTVSVGVAACPEDGLRPQDVLRKALDAIYRAKATGRNKVCLAREEKMVTKTTYYTQGQLAGLSRLAKRLRISEADLLREALDDLLRKRNA